MTTEKSTSIGGLDHACRCVVVARSAEAVRVHSCPPNIRGILSLALARLEKVGDSLPNNHVFCWDVFGFSYWDLHLCPGSIKGCWYSQYDVVGV
jgi:hypothetical protein